MESTKFEKGEQNINVQPPRDQEEDDTDDQDLMTTFDTMAGGKGCF